MYTGNYPIVATLSDGTVRHGNVVLYRSKVTEFPEWWEVVTLVSSHVVFNRHGIVVNIPIEDEELKIHKVLVNTEVSGDLYVSHADGDAVREVTLDLLTMSVHPYLNSDDDEYVDLTYSFALALGTITIMVDMEYDNETLWTSDEVGEDWLFSYAQGIIDGRD